MFLVLFGLYLLVQCILKKRLYFSKKDLPLHMLAVLFLLHLIGLTYSENVEYAWTEIGIKLSFFAFPLIALMMPSISSKQGNHVKLAFIIGCLSYLVVSVVTGVYNSLEQNDFSYLSYELLSAPYHPTYAATYQAMAVFMLIQNPSWLKFGLGKRIVFWLILLLMVLFISMLASKAGLLALWISLLMAAIFFFKNKENLRRALLLTASLMILSIASALYLPGVSSRIENAVKDVQTNAPTNANESSLENVPEQEAHSSTSLRMVTWSASLKLLLENPLGVGTGDTTNELVKIYDSTGEQHASEKKLNAHNQFLQTGAELGWPALIALCSSLALLFALYLKTKDFLLLNFLLLCGMNFLFESFIEVQAGIVFFCFWILIFLRKE